MKDHIINQLVVKPQLLQLKLYSTEIEHLVDILESKKKHPFTDVLDLFLSAYEMKLPVDYTKTVAQMIKDGDYQFIETLLDPKQIQIPDEINWKKKRLVVKLFPYHRNPDNDSHHSEVIDTMKKNHYRQATLFELLAFGYTYPDVQTLFEVHCGAADGLEAFCLGMHANRQGISRRISWSEFSPSNSARLSNEKVDVYFLGVRLNQKQAKKIEKTINN